MNKLITFLMLSLLSLSLSAQDEWIKEYYKPTDNWPLDLINSYDHGYLISAINESFGGYPNFSWIIKTDINGEILWDKMIGGTNIGFGLNSVLQTHDGGLVMVGGSYLFQLASDFSIVKLDACANKEWCKVYVTEENAVSGRKVFELEDHSLLVIVSFQEWNAGEEENVRIMKFGAEGNLIWEKDIFMEVPLVHDEYIHTADKVNDDLFIIKGRLFHRDNGGATWYKKPFIYAIDAEGNEKWSIIPGANEGFIGEACESVYNANGMIYTAGDFYPYYDNKGNDYPTLFKCDTSGNLIFSNFIFDDVEYSVTRTIIPVGDTAFDIAGSWRHQNKPNLAIVRVDTLGNPLIELNIMETEFAFSESIKTLDNKELFLNSNPSTKMKGDDALFLYKFNEHLEYDSIYPRPLEYDYLCDDLPIISDTIDPRTACDIITDIPSDIAFEHFKKIEIYPNPANNILRIKLPKATSEQRNLGPLQVRHFDYNYHDITLLVIYDIFGKKLKEIPLAQFTVREIEVNVEEFTSGIFLLALFNNQNIKLAEGKFLIK